MTQPRLDAEAAAVLEKLYEKFAATACTFLRSKGVASDVATELVHDSFEKIGRHLQRGGTTESPAAFVISVVRNTWVDWLRKPERRCVPVGDAGNHEDVRTGDLIDDVIDRVDRRRRTTKFNVSVLVAVVLVLVAVYFWLLW